MKQIKTIMRNASAPEEFDAEVNKAIAEGWTLVKRDVLLPYEGPTRIFHRMLYAELERETVEVKQAEQTTGRPSCWTCKWDYKKSNSEPCRNCNGGDRWEPKP